MIPSVALLIGAALVLLQALSIACAAAIPDLAGRHIAVPFRGDTPEIILDQLVVHHGFDADADLQITYAGTPTEAMQLMLSRRVDAALMTEPSTTTAILREHEVGRLLRRAIDLQDAWGEMTGAAPVLPQAGLAVMQGFMDGNGAVLPDLLAALEAATADLLADPQTAAAHAAEALGMPAPLLAAA